LSLPGRIALVGFMGSGKTTVGRALASRIGYAFLDSDDEIESRAQATVSDIFRIHGETFFRELEQGAIRDLLEGEGRVIATGGGAFAQARCAEELLARAFTVHLECDLSESLRRARASGGRPLLDQDAAAVASLYAGRKDKYARAHVSIDTTGRSPDEVVRDLLLRLPTS